MSEVSSFLPFLLQSMPPAGEPSVDQLSTKARKALVRLEAKRRGLQAAGEITDEGKLAILASAQNGWGRYSELENAEHLLSAERIARTLKSVGIVDIELVAGATFDDVMDSLRDPTISDLMYIGHAERSNLILDKPVTWKMLAEAATHLKHSVGVIGCSTSYEGTISPRVGSMVIPDGGLIYGKPIGGAMPGEMNDLGNFSVLSPQMADFDRLAIPQLPEPPAPQPQTGRGLAA